MTKYDVVAGMPERWITQIQDGVVIMVQKISDDSFVMRSSELPDFIANVELIDDGLVIEILQAIRTRSINY